jgi:hypothetical protein
VPVANNGYTGIFGKGGDFGYIRLSCAQKPDSSKNTAAGATANFIPGLSLKFLRNGMPSANLVAMFSVNGQPSWNFFANDFSTHIGAASGFTLETLSKKFATATPDVQTVGVSDFAMYNQDGSKVATPHFPFENIFRPSSSVANLFPADYAADFTVQLATIASGTTIYNMFAAQAPNVTPVHIGDIVLTTKFTTSYFADRYYFIKHQDMREDIAFHPEWDAYVPKTSCPFLAAQESMKTLTGLFQ